MANCSGCGKDLSKSKIITKIDYKEFCKMCVDPKTKKVRVKLRNTPQRGSVQGGLNG